MKSFKGDPSLTVVGIERNGSVAVLVVSPDLAVRLVDTYGVRESDEFTSMNGIVGLPCRWTEHAGVVVCLVLLPN